MPFFSLKKSQLKNDTLHHGFTFIELLLSITISTIIAVAGSVELFQFLAHQNLENEGKTIGGLLESARELSRHQDGESRWGVYIQNNESDRDIYALFMADETLVSSSSHVGAPGLITEQHSAKSNIEFIYPPTGSSSTILFSKLTGTPNTTSTIILQSGSNSSSQVFITVDSNGKIDYQ
jgi:prepilin-type N-terminal cleavage/methylation domain-containing protein